jgi:hypothetical protein
MHVKRRLMLVIAWLMGFASSFALAQVAADSGIARIPGAEATLGWQGEFSSGAWVEFRLVATGGGAFRATLETAEGSRLEGLTPITAKLEVSDAPGTRESRLLVPIMTTRVVKLSISGGTGSRSVRLEPKANALRINSERVPLEPGLYLSGHKIEGTLEPTTALAALAGGAQLAATPRLPSGALGLGGVDDSSRALNWFELLRRVEVQTTPPNRQSEVLALWCMAAFVVMIGLFSARRFDPKWLVMAAGGSATLALIGWLAWQPISTRAEAQTKVLIGARGWGLAWNVQKRFELRLEDARGWRLPPSAMILQPAKLARQYELEQTWVRASTWRFVTYLEPPKATRIPLRFEEDRLINDSSMKLEQLFILGHGALEPLLPNATRVISKATEVAYAPEPYDAWAEFLPLGTALARVAGQNTWLIALPERP